jgi:hypothetical protein
VSHSVGIIYEVKIMDAFDNLAKVAGSRLRDIPATLWEVVPYSFVVDWFFNVGDWIQAFTPAPGITPLRNWATVITQSDSESSAKCEWDVPLSEGSLSYEGDFGGVTTTSFSFQRFVDQSLPGYPVMRYNGFAWLHQTDALALSVGSILTGLKSWRH